MLKKIKPLKIGNKIAKLPIIQGGMGVGVSLGRLAGAVAKEGGVGIISTAQIGFYKEEFEQKTKQCNLEAIEEQIELAKSIAKGNGLVGVNVMVALADYKEHVKKAAECGADLIICGAGLPLDLPELVEGYDVKIAPIVSSKRAAKILFKKWEKDYNRLPDFLVVEGPKAGGHLGFKVEEVRNDIEGTLDYESEIKEIIEFAGPIPVVVAGGIWDKKDIEHAMELGASGVQMASRFVATHECDASLEYKKAYISASESDLRIIKSPVGLPGRAIYNKFLEQIEKEGFKVKRCFGCLAKCEPAKIPYCITKRLIMAVKGDVENGLIFCGANAGKIKEIVSVHELMAELV